MSHKPPTPKNAVSPYPLGAAQAADRDSAKRDLATQSAANMDSGSDGRGMRIAAGAAIGLAAIVAALIFWNRSRD